jgi:hypothetical protein
LPRSHTYHWDNIGFDGPVFATPRGYELPNPIAPPRTGTGYRVGPDGLIPPGMNNGGMPYTLAGVDLTGATRALFTFDAYAFDVATIDYCFNGCNGHTAWRTYTWPLTNPSQLMMAVAMPVDLADLKPGDNTIELRGHDNGIADAELVIETH